MNLLAPEHARTLAYLIMALGPLAALAGKARERSLGPRALLMRTLAPGVVVAVAATLADTSITSAAWLAALTTSYLAAWSALDVALGRGRIAAATVALLSPLPVAATFAPNACVESPSGALVHDAAPTLLQHLDPMIVAAHRLLADPVLVEDYYFYYQGSAPVPPVWRVVAVFLGAAAVGLLLGRLHGRAGRAGVA